MQNQSKISPFEFLAKVIKYRLQKEFTKEEVEPIDFNAEQLDDSAISQFISKTGLPFNETITILLGLAPHILPGFLDKILSDFFPEGADLPEFGGVKGQNYRGILPTGDTLLFILAGNDFQKRIDLKTMFEPQHIFSRNNIIKLGKPKEGEPKGSGRLLIDEEYLSWITQKRLSYPEFNERFPAQRITTDLDWEDLVLDKHTLLEIEHIKSWLQNSPTLMKDWGMHTRLKPGYRLLFYGDPGTGKTFTATLLGKITQKDVYRIDLSMVVSKFIGETEKNLSNLFDKAENKDWILFFDEADSIFGKRTEVRDAHDKYANQEVSYLLQRIEDYSGLVILASNFKKNIDSAFTRRFQSIIEFKQPSAEQRLLLWQKNIPEKAKLSPEVDIEKIAFQYEITGANIVNVIQYASIKTLARQSNVIQLRDLLEGIKKEYIKEGRMM